MFSLPFNLMNFIYFESGWKFNPLDLFLSKHSFSEFQLLLSRVAPYLQFVTTNCSIKLLLRSASSSLLLILICRCQWLPVLLKSVLVIDSNLEINWAEAQADNFSGRVCAYDFDFYQQILYFLNPLCFPEADYIFLKG